MKKEDQVCSLESSKRLLALGVKQNSLWFWCDIFSEDWKLCYSKDCENDIFLHDIQREKCAYSAFTVAELVEMLPDIDNRTKLRRIVFGIENVAAREGLGGKYYCIEDLINYPKDYEFYSDNFAECLAMMVIRLIENGLIKC